MQSYAGLIVLGILFVFLVVVAAAVRTILLWLSKLALHQCPDCETRLREDRGKSFQRFLAGILLLSCTTRTCPVCGHSKIVFSSLLGS